MFLRNVSILTSGSTIYAIARLSDHVIENLNIYKIRKQTCELSLITMLTSTKAKEMVNKYEVFYYLNVFGLRVERYIVEKNLPDKGAMSRK